MPFSTDLSDLAGLGDDDIPLAESALRIALAEYPVLDPARWIGEIDRLAERARTMADSGETAMLLDAIDRSLFTEAGFHGDTDSYYDPRNSFLNDVIERRTGIPITLSVVYIAVGQRLGLELRGIGFPGHFLVRCFGTDQTTLIDPFNGGARLGRDECAGFLPSASTSDALDDSFFDPVTHQQILLRMLTNLKLIYVQRKDHARAVAAIDRILQLAPGTLAEHRDRGLIRLQAGDARLALKDLEYYIDNVPPSPERDRVVTAVGTARREVARYN